jgi:hypothetical protein
MVSGTKVECPLRTTRPRLADFRSGQNGLGSTPQQWVYVGKRCATLRLTSELPNSDFDRVRKKHASGLRGERL